MSNATAELAVVRAAVAAFPGALAVYLYPHEVYGGTRWTVGDVILADGRRATADDVDAIIDLDYATRHLLHGTAYTERRPTLDVATVLAANA